MNSRSSLLKTGWSLSPDGNGNSKTAWNLIRQTHPKVDYAGIVWNKFNISKHSIIAWMALNSGLLTADRVSRFYPNIVTLCGLCMLEDESAEHLCFQCSYAGWIWAQLCSKFGYDQPATNLHDVCRWINEIKTKNSAFTGLILKLSFTAVIYYVWRERNSRRHEGNPSSKQNVVLENCKGSQIETAFGFLSDETESY